MESARTWDGQVVSSSPSSVEYISHVHRAYDYSGPFGVSLGTYGLIQKLCLKEMADTRQQDKEQICRQDQIKPQMISTQEFY